MRKIFILLVVFISLPSLGYDDFEINQKIKKIREQTKKVKEAKVKVDQEIGKMQVRLTTIGSDITWTRNKKSEYRAKKDHHLANRDLYREELKREDKRHRYHLDRYPLLYPRRRRLQLIYRHHH